MTFFSIDLRGEKILLPDPQPQSSTRFFFHCRNFTRIIMVTDFLSRCQFPKPCETLSLPILSLFYLLPLSILPPSNSHLLRMKGQGQIAFENKGKTSGRESGGELR